jgi:hypothetical protein
MVASASTVALASASTVALASASTVALASASQDGAGAAAVAAVVAAGKQKSTNIKGHEYPILFLLFNVWLRRRNMMLRGID